MTRELFLQDLSNALCGLDEDEIESVLAYYNEMISDRMEAGMSEEDAVSAMEPVDTIAARVLSEAEGEKAPEEAAAPEKNENEKEIRRSAKDIAEIVISAENQRVHLTSADTDEVVLRYRIGEADIYQLHEEGGVLTLEHKNRPVSSYKIDLKHLTADNFFGEIGKFIGSINLSGLIGGIAGDTRSIEVALPRVYEGKVTVRTSNARITADNVNCIDVMKLKTSNARIALEHTAAPQINIATSNGRILLENVYAREQINAETSNGRIEAGRTICDHSMHLRTSNASVRVEDAAADVLVIKTSNASVTGTVKGKKEEYAVHSGTSNGKNNLTDCAEGEKQLTVRTCNGNIAIEFQE